MVLGFAFLVAVVALGCNGDDDGGSSTPGATEVPPQPTETAVATAVATGTVAATSTAVPTAEPTLEPPAPRLTGIEVLDDVIRLIEANAPELVDLLVLQTLPCSTGIGMEGPQPSCGGDEADGTLVEVFSYPQCDGRWLREANLDIALGELAAMGPLRYAAFEPSADYLLDAAYVAVFEGPDPRFDGEFLRGAAVGIEKDGRISSIWLACGAGDPGASLIPDGLTEFLLESAAKPITSADEFRATELFAALPAEVSAAIVAVLDRDFDALEGLVAWELRACAIDWSGGPPSPPVCQPGEDAGTSVDSIALGSGETQYVHRGELAERLGFVFDDEQALCSVRQLEDGRFVAQFRRRAGATSDATSFGMVAGRIDGFGQSVEFPGEFGPCTAA